jgi:uncharacterized protein DUF4160
VSSRHRAVIPAGAQSGEICGLRQLSSEPVGFDFSSIPTKASRVNSGTSMSSKEKREAKFWLRPEMHLAYNDGFSARALRELLTLIEANRERIEKAWDEFFG